MFHCSALQKSYILKQRTDSDSIDSYYKECEIESNYILGYIKNLKPIKILDIGCGMGGIDLLLSDSVNAHYYLYDKNDNEVKDRYGFSEKPRYYSNIELMKQFVAVNRPSMKATITDDISVIPEVDVVISTYSMGWHYPIEEYLQQILGLLKPKGLMIVDIRSWNDYNDYIINILLNDFNIVYKDHIQIKKGYRYVLEKK